MKKNLPIFVAVFFSALGLYLRIQKLSGHSFTPDELMQLHIINNSFWGFLKSLPDYEFCSFLSGDYYLIYPFFKIFSYNKWSLAIPHIIATVLGFYLLYLICRLYFKTLWGYVITFAIACFNANLIIHATEIRTYAVLPTLALASFYFSQLLAEQINMSIRKKLFIGGFFVLVIWFHAYGILMLFLSFAFSLFSKLYEKNFKEIFLSNLKLLVTVSFIALPLWAYSVFGPHLSYPDYTAHLMFEYIPNPINDFVGFLKGIFGNLMGYKKLYPLLMGIIFPVVLAYKDKYKQMAFLLIMVFLPIILILLSDLRMQYWFAQRQFVWVVPFFAFYIGWVWDLSLIYFYERFK